MSRISLINFSFLFNFCLYKFFAIALPFVSSVSVRSEAVRRWSVGPTQQSYRVLVGWLGRAYMQPSASRSTIRRGGQKARGWQVSATSGTLEITV